jgi:tetratricopeptide (TPR) repeat protein
LAILGATYLQQQRYPEANKVLRDAWEQEKNLSLTGGYLGYAHAASGDAPRARAVLQELQELAKQRYVSPVVLAVVHVGLGEMEEALMLLEQGYREGDPYIGGSRCIRL